MSDDISSDSEVHYLRYECDEGIFMYEKSSTMLDMDIWYASCFREEKCEPSSRSKSNMRNDEFRIFMVYISEYLPKSSSPKCRKREVLHGLYDREIYSSCESRHLTRKKLLKCPCILLDATRMIESEW